MLLARSRLEDQFRFRNFPDDPILVHFVRVEIAVGCWSDVFGSFPWRETILFAGANDPVVNFKSAFHARLQPVKSQLIIFDKGNRSNRQACFASCLNAN